MLKSKNIQERKYFTPRPRKKVLVSNDFREVLVSQETSIIEQRVITIILSCIKEEQSLFISVKSPLNINGPIQFNFDDYFEGWANQGTVNFEIPLKFLNPKRIMKNMTIKSALVNMANINWLQLKDSSINGYQTVPFILKPQWNKNNLYFKMDKTVLKHLLNMSHYFPLKKDLAYQVSSSNTLRFLMWIMKFKKFGGLSMEYSQILKQFSINKDKYEGRSRFERDFLQSIKADLDSFNDLSFNYAYHDGKYTFSIYNTSKSTSNNVNFVSLNDLQVERSIKYLKRKRTLNDANVRTLRKLFDIKGYKELSTRLKNKIDSKLNSDNYIKAVFNLLEKQS
ncbi:replication initiation protein [Kaistella jeonii]|uniref:Uncharacterized protein n=1 Tax=Kaistella jeonii TaxID=266749 RepID=A0A0C1FP29_9FLAO|nr:replication initiation protein [Kaistella jeonii]KIA89609.1 hypothetical protein OA86_02965 [Kaistella jeonii]SFB90005.1 Initiator Replication protein [Kaistella jeonii]VEI95820.1 Protein involved in initiation of plasmid replication [Kaistella jeonii]